MPALTAAKLTVRYSVYGSQGLREQVQDIVLPFEFPPLPPAGQAAWRPCPFLPGASVLPVRTHLLSHLDNPGDVADTYTQGIRQPGDVVVLNESAVAIMQGRFRNPANIRPSLLARLACRLFAPASSMASACGLQVLIDLVGVVRTLVALVAGVIGRVLGRRGVFYEVAGPQARLIDDVSGTLPPFDKVVVLGPIRARETAEAVARRIGTPCCIVDANDLHRVDVIGSSAGVDPSLIERALQHNPAGNADERTPIVLIRAAGKGGQHVEGDVRP